jgi:hypothetical protein
LPYLQSSKAKFVITLINKADMWANRTSEVHDYYSKGEYAQKFKEHLFLQPHYLVPYCALLELFYGVFNSGVYGISQQKIHKNGFIAYLSQLLK